MDAADEPDVWDRLDRLWHGLFALTLLIPTTIALVLTDLALADRVVVAAGAAALAAWHWLMVVRHPEWAARRWLPLGLYWLGTGALAVLLGSRHESFAILLYGLYPLAFITLGYWGLVPVLGLTAALGWATGTWTSGRGAAASLLASGAVALLIAVFVSAISRQSAQRRDALTALADTRAELAAASRKAGALAERERLARELHDTVAQGFASVVTQLESAEQALADRPGVAAEHLAKARRIARESLTEVRRSVRALRPDLLQEASLPAALSEAVRVWSADTGVPAELRTTGEPVGLPADTELALLRTAQEALSNAARHAAASQVVVTLSFLGDTVTLDVDDDGVGFAHPPRPTEDGGYGLIGMRERIRATGGVLSIESAAGRGTTVAASVPV